MLLRLNTTVKSNERGCQRKGSHSAILIVTVPTQFQPMPLLKRAAPFDDPDWIYELKMDGFRALAIVEHGRAQLLSRNGHPFASFSALAESISDSLPNVRAVIDGEICSLDRRGRPQFRNLLFHRGNPPCFFAFDLLTCDGKDLRTERLLDRKQELRRLLVRSPVTSPCLRIGLGGHRCQAEICTLRHGAGAQYVVQDFESEIFAEGWQGGIVREGATQRTCPRLAFVCVSL